MDFFKLLQSTLELFQLLIFEYDLYPLPFNLGRRVFLHLLLGFLLFLNQSYFFFLDFLLPDEFGRWKILWALNISGLLSTSEHLTSPLEIFH